MSPREALQTQVHSALNNTIPAVAALWSIERALAVEDAGGSVDWDRVEDDLWKAAETVGFAHTYVHDDAGVIEQWLRLEDHPSDGPKQVSEELRERPPMQLLDDIQKLAADPDSKLRPEDLATIASNVNDRETMGLAAESCRGEGAPSEGSVATSVTEDITQPNAVSDDVWESVGPVSKRWLSEEAMGSRIATPDGLQPVSGLGSRAIADYAHAWRSRSGGDR
ncbi:hypothetical protein GQS65_19060 [Halomarina oriensis]|uniref:Uncharacterized protein n=2 Tax=Halomarina oriensis TaxID=671145 RepID=A0A6B0GR54_9EURY|nr:hypothetical protein [Halomarina oriensis]